MHLDITDNHLELRAEVHIFNVNHVNDVVSANVSVIYRFNGQDVLLNGHKGLLQRNVVDVVLPAGAVDIVAIQVDGDGVAAKDVVLSRNGDEEANVFVGVGAVDQFVKVVNQGVVLGCCYLLDLRCFNYLRHRELCDSVRVISRKEI